MHDNSEAIEFLRKVVNGDHEIRQDKPVIQLASIPATKVQLLLVDLFYASASFQKRFDHLMNFGELRVCLVIAASHVVMQLHWRYPVRVNRVGQIDYGTLVRGLDFHPSSIRNVFSMFNLDKEHIAHVLGFELNHPLDEAFV